MVLLLFFSCEYDSAIVLLHTNIGNDVQRFLLQIFPVFPLSSIYAVMGINQRIQSSVAVGHIDAFQCSTPLGRGVFYEQP